MCLLDFMRLSSGPKPRKSLKEISDRYSSNYMQKYNDINIIHFNENISMTSKSNTIKFSRCPTRDTVVAGNGSSNANNGTIISISKSNKNKQHCNYNGFKTNKSLREWGMDNIPYDLSTSTDEPPETSTDTTDVNKLACNGICATAKTTDEVSAKYESETTTSGGEGDDCHCDFSDNAVTGQLDSFCTLCTSSFSFNNCNQCDKSTCSSKCHSTKKSCKLFLTELFKNEK